MNKHISFAYFMRMLKVKDGQEFINEAVKSQGGFFGRFISLERTFEQWMRLSFVWSKTEKDFDYWSQKADQYLRYYRQIDEEGTSHGTFVSHSD
jgi:hypothetical protein